jgi:hypothetical protein
MESSCFLYEEVKLPWSIDNSSLFSKFTISKTLAEVESKRLELLCPLALRKDLLTLLLGLKENIDCSLNSRGFEL